MSWLSSYVKSSRSNINSTLTRCPSFPNCSIIRRSFGSRSANHPGRSRSISASCVTWSMKSTVTANEAQAYFGDCTPLNRGKDFVVRGQPWQHYSDLYVVYVWGMTPI